MLRLYFILALCLALVTPAFSQDGPCIIPGPDSPFQVGNVSGNWWRQRAKDGLLVSINLVSDQRPIARWSIRYCGFKRERFGRNIQSLVVQLWRKSPTADTYTFRKWVDGQTAVECTLSGAIKPAELQALVQLSEALLEYLQKNGSAKPLPEELGNKIAACMATPLEFYLAR